MNRRRNPEIEWKPILLGTAVGASAVGLFWWLSNRAPTATAGSGPALPSTPTCSGASYNAATATSVPLTAAGASVTVPLCVSLTVVSVTPSGLLPSWSGVTSNNTTVVAPAPASASAPLGFVAVGRGTAVITGQYYGSNNQLVTVSSTVTVQ